MIAGSVRKISLVALLVATAALLVPGAAQAAAPTIYCVVAYGHENPGNCDPQPDLNAPAYAGRIYPISQPYGYGDKGLLFVEGVTNASASVLVSVTDGIVTPNGIVTLSRRVEATGLGEFKADLKVTNLGLHAGTGGAACNGIVSGACNGISTLTITVVATVGAQTASRTTTIDKYAIAPGDQGLTGKDKYKPVYPAIIRDPNAPSPKIRPNPTYPPASWIHLLSTGSSAVASISGLVEDDYANAYGHASEIASIKVKITQGPALIKDFGDVANRVNSTQASFDIKVNINNFEPSFPFNDPYSVSIEVKDANGNTVTTGQDFDVYPV